MTTGTARGRPPNKPYYKIIKSGNIYEVYMMEKPPIINEKGLKRQDKELSDMSAWIQEETRELQAKCMTKEEAAMHNARRAKANFRRLISANFKDRDKFITLTFRDSPTIDITDVEQTNREFKKFIQRLRRRYKDFKYVCVIEFQDGERWKKKGVDKEGRHAVHYHMIADLPFIDYQELAEIWGLGFIGINAIKGCDNIGAYIGKYLSKERDERLGNKKTYFTSRNMERPEIIKGNEGEQLYEKLIAEGKIQLVYTNAYDSEYNGKINYFEFNENWNTDFRRNR